MEELASNDTVGDSEQRLLQPPGTGIGICPREWNVRSLSAAGGVVGSGRVLL